MAANIEELVALAAAGGDELAASLGLSEGEQLEAQADEATAKAGAWTQERLNKPLFPGSEKTVRQAVYTIMRAASGNVRQGTLDELIKSFKAFLPPDNDLPG